MKRILKHLLPTSILNAYYYLTAKIGEAWYGSPSKRMLVIGVTGTKGKTSTINFIWSCLSSAGYKTGIISTANIRIGDKEILNAYHMTMPGRFTLQKLMKEMADSGCKVCLIETTSEGIKQYRHIGITYDMAVFTNLTPEHLQSHGGSFEEYKRMKGKLFSTLSKHDKYIDGQLVKKVIIANKDSEHSGYFLHHSADVKISYGINEQADYRAEEIQETNEGVHFSVHGTPFTLSILGKFNVYNALPAIAIAKYLGVSDSDIQNGLRTLTKIPGRMEKINVGQSFTVIVDYAHEKESMTNVLRTMSSLKREGSRVIVIVGAEGGGRDKAKRPLIGELASRFADYVIVTNVDPYDDDPMEILEDIAVTSVAHGKVRNENLFVIEDRRLAIQKALSLARVDDIVLVTGKGAEQSMIIKGSKIKWDDRSVVREELRKINIL